MSKRHYKHISGWKGHMRRTKVKPRFMLSIIVYAAILLSLGWMLVSFLKELKVTG